MSPALSRRHNTDIHREENEQMNRHMMSILEQCLLSRGNAPREASVGQRQGGRRPRLSAAGSWSAPARRTVSTLLSPAPRTVERSFKTFNEGPKSRSHTEASLGSRSTAAPIPAGQLRSKSVRTIQPTESLKAWDFP